MARYNPGETTHGEKIIRLFTKLLFSKRKWALVELARELKCSKQTVSRLVDEITTCYSVQIMDFTEKGRKYYQLKHRQADPILNLSRSEVEVLMMCRSFAKHILGEKLFGEATRALEKSEAQIPTDQRSGRSHFDAISVGTIDYSAVSDQIQALIRGMNGLRVCKISYKAIESPRTKTFYVKPIKMFSHKNALYLHAKLAKYPGRKYQEPDFDPLLAVHRIKKVEVTDRGFDYPGTFNFDKSFNRSFGLIKNDAFEVEVKFNRWAAAYATERIWSQDQKMVNNKDGSISLIFTASSKLELMSWVLSFGDAAHLVRPQSIVAELKTRISRMNGIYGM